MDETIQQYTHFHSEGDGGHAEDRKSHYAEMVNQYYNLVTDFYEFGWGESFHFAPRHKGESFEGSLARHQHYLASKLHLNQGQIVADLGCGVGGPMRSIARFSGAEIVGINNNAYQISRGEKHNLDAGLTEQCSFVKADFMSLPQADNTFDAMYGIEATCHAPDKLALYTEVMRVLKPGGLFAAYEWCLTDRYDPNNAEHRAIKKGIEEGDGLPDLDSCSDVLVALKAAGFIIEESEDRVGSSDPDFPWYRPLDGSGYTPRELRMKPVGRYLTRQAVRFMEAVHIAPKGSVAVSQMLESAALALVAGGQRGIFTPMFLFVARKPHG